jgi:type I restriction enzyme, S subunit
MSVVGKPGYRETDAGWIPSDWQLCKLGDLVNKVGSGVTPKGGSDSYLSSGLPLIRSQNVLWGKLDLSDVAYISADQHRRMANSALQPRDVLLNITGASIGRCAVIPTDFREGNVNQHVCIIRPTASLRPTFLSQYLISQFGQVQISKLQAGGNREGLNYQQIRGFAIAIPPLPEQQKIADILTTVDDKLDVISRQIDATQTLKRGLMQTLFSRGVGTQGADGRWVPHTEFKDSELGEIPVGWDVRLISDVFDIAERPVKMRDDQPYRRVTVKRRHGGIELRDELNGAKIKVKNQFLLKAGDFLISERQIVHGACGIVPADLEGALVSNEYLVLKAREGFDAAYFSYMVQLLKYAKLFLLCSQGIDIEKFLFKPKDWLKKRIPAPPLPEQQRIAQVLASVEIKTNALQEKHAEYQNLKRGLMQKLLTGEWRVTMGEHQETAIAA